ncbi:MAG: VOC family protein [Chitinophagaceae bacterium]|nr:VOC family protein [Chitinophagaceae bacterium]
MSKPVYPCIWFDGTAKEAAELYCSLFAQSAMKECTHMVVNFEIGGQHIMGLNAGPMFKPNAAISFYATFEDKEALLKAWNTLLQGGSVLMPLDKYQWSEQYGWLQDKYGVNWQLTYGKVSAVGQAVVPLFMFCGENQGKAEAAMNYYISLFDNGRIEMAAHYEEGMTKVDAHVVHARFRINDSLLIAMDSAVAQPFTFSEGISMVVTCDTQEEIDHYWNKLSVNGRESMCGWCRDQFGVWWQVVPSVLGQLMMDRERAPRVMDAFMKMKKFNIQALLDA